MAKPSKFIVRRTARFTAESDQKLIERAKLMKIAPAVAIRIFVDHALAQDPAGGGNLSERQFHRAKVQNESLNDSNSEVKA